MIEKKEHLVLGEIKLPWKGDLSLLCTASYGGQGSKYHCDERNAYYALDFDRPWEGNIEPKTEILTIASGNVCYVCHDLNNILGLHIKVQHTENVISLYAHLKEVNLNIRVGMKLEQGFVLGLLGETGQAAGPHLHFQLFVNNKCCKHILEAKPEPISGYCALRPNRWYKSNNRILEATTRRKKNVN